MSDLSNYHLNSYHWPDTFWPSFIDQYWQQHSTCFKCPGELPFISLTELFHVVTSMPGRIPSDRFWIVRNSPPKSIHDFRMGALDLLGPQKSDRNFDGYFKRLENHIAGINIHNLDAANTELLKRIAHFVNQLSTVPNRPPVRYWGLDTFFGTYHATPFGIHRDNASVFSFILKGKRTYATWKANYFKPTDQAIQTPDIDQINAHLPYAETFTVAPGEIFYWPSNRWHVALSDGKPSVVAQISAYFDKKNLNHWRAT